MIFLSPCNDVEYFNKKLCSSSVYLEVESAVVLSKGESSTYYYYVLRGNEIIEWGEREPAFISS